MPESNSSFSFRLVIPKNLSIVLLLFFFVTISGCKDDIQNANPIIFPDSNISYGKHVEPLFQQRCALAGCHAGSNPQAGLNLTTPSYSNLMNHEPRLVIAGESNNSLLAQRIDGRITPRMPFNSTPLTDNQIKGIKKWIDEGGVNN